MKTADLAPAVRDVQKARFTGSVLYRVYSLGALEEIRQLDSHAQVILHLDDYFAGMPPLNTLLEKYPDLLFSSRVSSWRLNFLLEAKSKGARIIIEVLGPDVTDADLKRAFELKPFAIQTSRQGAVSKEKLSTSVQKSPRCSKFTTRQVRKAYGGSAVTSLAPSPGQREISFKEGRMSLVSDALTAFEMMLL